MVRVIEMTTYVTPREYEENISATRRSYFTSTAMFEDLKFLLSWSTIGVYVVKVKDEKISVNGN